MKVRRFIRGKLFALKKFFSSWKKILALVLLFIFSFSILIMIVHLWVANSYSDRKYSYDQLDEIPEKKVAIVFGAGLDEEGAGDYLTDRVMTGVELYKEGKVNKLIMSGDNRTEYHDEPSAMIDLALEEGVPEYALQPDYAGRRTYDTCARAKKIFKIDEAILVTQDFHMDRALYTCDSLGIDVIGITSNISEYKNENIQAIRDYFALIRAIWDLHIDEPNDVVLGDVIEL